MLFWKTSQVQQVRFKVIGMFSEVLGGNKKQVMLHFCT